LCGRGRTDKFGAPWLDLLRGEGTSSIVSFDYLSSVIYSFAYYLLTMIKSCSLSNSLLPIDDGTSGAKSVGAFPRQVVGGWNPVSKAALKREEQAKVKFATLVDMFLASDDASNMVFNEKRTFALLGPNEHLVSACWKTFKAFVTSYGTNPGRWQVTRVIASEADRQKHKFTRKGKAYFVFATYSAPFAGPSTKTPPQQQPMVLTNKQQPQIHRTLLPPMVLPVGSLLVTICDQVPGTAGHPWVKAVEPNSPMAGKLQSGDWIVQICGLPVSDKDSSYCATILRQTSESNMRTIQVARLAASPVTTAPTGWVTTATASKNGTPSAIANEDPGVLASIRAIVLAHTAPKGEDGDLAALVSNEKPEPGRGENPDMTAGIKSATEDGPAPKKQKLGDSTNANGPIEYEDDA